MMSAHGENLTNEGEDARVESALLQRVLDLHPTRVTADELVRDLAGEDAGFAARDGRSANSPAPASSTAPTTTSSPPPAPRSTSASSSAADGQTRRLRAHR
jgi:hypothetical protein